MKTRTPHHRLPLAALSLGLILALPAQAALHDRGGGLIYDDVLKITWLADANYAKTSNHDADGLMNWTNAVTWADNLSYFDSVRNVTYSDWRLPTLNASDTSCSSNFNPGGGFPTQYHGTGCTGGELSHLLVADLGNKAGESVLIQTGDTPEQIANLALFSNVQSYLYWSGTEYAPDTGAAWRFGDGATNANQKYFDFNAWAVRPGDVAAAPIPEAESYALMLLGMGLVGWLARRKAA